MPDLRPVLFIIGLLLVALGASMLLPALIDLLDGDPEWRVFVDSAGIAATAGGAIALAFRPSRAIDITVRGAFLLTTLTWVMVSLFAAVPLIIGSAELDLTDAYFEAMSGLTTTGSTVIPDVEAQSKGTLLWRALLQMFGGIGIVVIAVAVLPVLRVGGMQLFRSESSDKSEKIRPRMSQVSGMLISVYLLMSVICAALLAIAGMPLFEAVCHAMAAISTGGYSTRNLSLAAFPDPVIHWILTIFMFVGGMTFVLLAQAIRGNPGPLWRDTQTRWYVGYLAGFILAMTLWQVLLNERPFFDALTASAFNVVSVATTTGFASEDFLLWGSLPVMGFMILLFLGGCTGSTSGGIKVFRYCVLGGVAHGLVRSLVHPHRVQITTYNQRPVGDDVIRSVLGFFFFYMAAFAILTVIFACFVDDAMMSISAIAQALANVGPGLVPQIGPVGHFADLPGAAKWVLTVAMLLGRLELLTVLVLLSPTFWRG